MILSKNRELGEFEKIQAPEHIARVWGKIEDALPRYWDWFVDREVAKSPSAKLGGLYRTSGGPASPTLSAVMASFASAVEHYEKYAQKYRAFFDHDAMDEYRDNPNWFKQNLAKEVPIIAGTLNQRRPELQEWQTCFRGAKGADLLGVLSNLLDFRTDWLLTHPEDPYRKYDSLADFGLEPFEDDEMTLANVIGGGIKSVILHMLSPDRLPQRARSDLYGLYFLSGMDGFGLASQSSEFLMINDREPTSNGSLIMEHNFWYPYGLYSLYALRIYRWLEAQVQALGGGLDVHVRHVYVAHFMNQVCLEHVADMKVMRAHDRFEVPG